MTQAKPKAARNKTTGAARKQPTAGSRKETPRKTKATLMREMLACPSGASLDAICTATGWQQHSVRAALSVLRKKGATIERRAPDTPGAPATYHLVSGPEPR